MFLDEDEEEDEPITMGGKKPLPKIIETAGSPNEKEIKQIESVLWTNSRGASWNRWSGESCLIQATKI